MKTQILMWHCSRW